MRLTCPNCDAQYEVPDDVVPTSGRDVQCSNCGQTWFQHHPDHLPEEEAEDLEELLQEPDTPDPDEEVAPPPPPIPPKPIQRELDPAVADILRQEAEAEHEARKRRQEADQDPLESQPDLGLDQAERPETDDGYVPAHDAENDTNASDDPDDADTRSSQARSRMARMRGEPVPEADLAGAAVSSRRELLPDIEEINSTLRSEDQYEDDANYSEEEDAPLPRKRSGFRSGFLLIVVLFVIGTLIYVFAPQLANAVPQLDPMLSGFVAWVDGMRMWLDGQLEAIGNWLNDKAAQSTN
ncbi:zinc-ribbon domain-containing protein [Sulfitobacter sp. JB4-11]|uniref:zinc-ribbon domain-containing protein n=1 Tax=Sulfitobacter rhodophyticola TaxID=3238304 RepID=UPI003D816044